MAIPHQQEAKLEERCEVELYHAFCQHFCPLAGTTRAVELIGCRSHVLGEARLVEVLAATPLAAVKLCRLAFPWPSNEGNSTQHPWP